jgi:hypothetical protein
MGNPSGHETRTTMTAGSQNFKRAITEEQYAE